MPDAPAARTSIRSRTFAAFDVPDFRRFSIGQGVSLIGTWLQAAAVSWIVFDMTHSERMLGLIDAISIVPGLLVGLVAGALADRVAPRSMILVMQIGQMLLAFLLALLVGTGVVRIWQMALILALTRVLVTFEMPSRQVFLYDLVGREALMNAIALNSGLFNASRVIGPALAGLCLAWLGRTACFALNDASYLAAIAALLLIDAGRQATPRPDRGSADLLGGIDYLRRDRRVLYLFLLMAFFGLIGMGYSALMPAYARLVVRTEGLGYSLLVAAGGLGATFGALVIASLGGLGRKDHLVLGGMILFAACLAAGGLLPAGPVRGWSLNGRLIVASICLFGAGVGGIFFYAATQTLIQTAVPDHLCGRIMGIWMIVYSGSVPLGSLWAGELALRHGVVLVLLVSSALCLVVALAVLASGILEAPAHHPPLREGEPA